MTFTNGAAATVRHTMEQTTMNTTARNWSEQQTTIFTWFETAKEILDDVSRHLVVRARAGTGKTTTIIEAVNRVSTDQSVLVCAFSKTIELELTKRIGQSPNVVAKTLHALGFACVRRFRDNMRVDSTRADKLAWTVCGKHAPDTIVRLVSKLHTKGREIAPFASKLGDLAALQITFECVPDESWENTEYNTQYVERKAIEAMELAANVQSGEGIDYSDMLFLPVRNSWMVKTYDMVVVDEAQDMTPTQLAIAKGMLNDGGNIVIVGDDKQAIFAFRGADCDTLDNLKRELNANELGLNTTYRCGKAIVALAQQYVPDFKADINNADGVVSEITADKLVGAAAAGDFILSRVNAPLVSIAMQLLRSGKRARVAGRDIGAGLRSLVRKLNARTVPELLTKIEGWSNKETARVQAQLKSAANGRKAALNAKIETILDQADMLTSLVDGARSVDEVTTRIEALFSDDGLGAAGMITCSSVHRSKGLEANRVFVMKDTLRNNSQEELNICYVAVTRAKNELVFVTSSK